MIVTLFGIIVFVIGAYLLLRGSATAMLVFVMTCTLFGGAATLFLPALGGSSVQPAMLASIFLVVHCVLRIEPRQIAKGFADNRYLVVFGLYAAVTAFVLPRLFEESIYVVPMKPIGLDTYQTVPLTFTNQNITHAINITGTMLAGVCASAVALRDMRPVRLLRAGANIGLIHAALGVLDLILTPLHQQWVLDIFRNGSYSQVDQVVSGFTRINGVFPEPSTYAAYGFFWFVFATEAWLRNLEPRRTGAAALALLAVLIFTTSSTAYAGLAAYFLVLMVRWLVFPGSIRARRGVVIAFLALVLGTGVVGLMVVAPAAYSGFASVVEQMTFGKASSGSGLERQMWARQGWEAFKTSYGLGIGAGSFRSSSFAAAVLGSLGVVGVTTYVLHVLQTLKPARLSTYVTVASQPLNVGSAFAWAAAAGMLPAMASAASPDPGVVFAIFAGVGLAYRRQKRERTRLVTATSAPKPAASAAKPVGGG